MHLMPREGTETSNRQCRCPRYRQCILCPVRGPIHCKGGISLQAHTRIVTLSGFLADVGEPAARADGYARSAASVVPELLAGGDGAVLACVRHLQDSPDALCADSPVFVVRLADRIAAGAPAGQADTARKQPLAPLVSPFATMKGEYGKHICRPVPTGAIPFPVEAENASLSADEMRKIAQGLEKSLQNTAGAGFNTLYKTLAQYLSCLPENTAANAPRDISIFDHAKLRAALAACIAEYCCANGITDLRRALSEDADRFLATDAFLLYSCDISGIQNFIYNITSSGALKSLRGRSFALEMLMEHFLDELLEAAELTRANLIYSGGGHCYVLLPNTEKARKAADDCAAMIRRWLIAHYGTALYFASAYVPCSANALMNVPAEKAPYSAVFIALSRALSAAKLHRYTADEIRCLNAQPCGETECTICGRTSEGGICPDCAVFQKIGGELVRGGKYIAVTKSPIGGVDWALPSLVQECVWLNFTDKADSPAILRFHTINDDTLTAYDERFAGDLSVGTYCYNSNLGAMSESAREVDGGIKRIAVCRADVDNLGTAFIYGFVDKNAKNPAQANRYVTLSRTAAFSRSMSLFFKRYINDVLSTGCDFQIGERSDANRVNIVYSGGDDVFLVGVWDDVISSAVNLRNAFLRYCCGALTISAGIGIFRVKHPISAAAASTAELEDAAKARCDANGRLIKDAVALFDVENEYIFDWDTLREKVIGEKLALIQAYLDSEQDAESDRHGKAMLYRMLALCQNVDNQLNIAKIAYLLARMEPSSGDTQRHTLYRRFADNVYTWATVPADRQELIMAICIYSYLTRQ